MLGKYSSRVIFFLRDSIEICLFQKFCLQGFGIAFSFFYIQWLISLERFQQSFTYAVQAALYSLGCLLCCFLWVLLIFII